MIFNKSSDVIMTSFITQKETESTRHLGSAILNYFSVFHFTSKTRINRGDFN